MRIGARPRFLQANRQQETIMETQNQPSFSFHPEQQTS